MVAIVNAATGPHEFLMLRKDAMIAKPASPRDLHLLAGMLMQYLDTQEIEHPTIPPDALVKTKIVLRLIVAEKDSNFHGLIEDAVMEFIDWTFDSERNFMPVPSACNFDGAAAALHALVDEKLTGLPPRLAGALRTPVDEEVTGPPSRLAGGVVDVNALLRPQDLPGVPSEEFVFMALWRRAGPIPTALDDVVKPGPNQLDEQKRLCADAFKAAWVASIQNGDLELFKGHLATCYEAFVSELLVPGNEVHEEMAKILLNGGAGSGYFPAKLGQALLNEVATFLLDAIRGNSATIQRLAARKHPFRLIPRPQLKELLASGLVTSDEYYEAFPPDTGPTPGSARFQKIVRKNFSEVDFGPSGTAIVITHAEPGTPREREVERNLRKAGWPSEECMVAPPNFVHSSCIGYKLKKCPYNDTIQVIQIVLANGTVVDALEKEGRTTGAGHGTSDISWKGHPDFEQFKTAKAAAPVMSSAAGEIWGLVADVREAREDHADFNGLR